jgi:hypothetical protein
MRALIIAVLIGLAAPAGAHDWYPRDCCSGFDCFPIADNEVEPIANGFRIRLSGQTVTGSQVRRSEDGRFHLCTKGGEPAGEPLCLFEPPKGF